MDDKQHFIQDASELYAVYKLQALAENVGVAEQRDSDEKLSEFEKYVQDRDVSTKDLTEGPNSAYRQNVDTHVPGFLSRLVGAYPERRFSFRNVEAEYRNLNRKADFVITLDGVDEIPVSLKNYRSSALRPQVCSGTYNSFILNFLLESDGVGCFINPKTGTRFQSASFEARDQAMRDLGHPAVVPLLHKLDELNKGIKERFVYGRDFEFLNEQAFDAARKECGSAGAATTLTALASFDESLIRTRILKMTGLDGAEEQLMMDPHRSTDSITNVQFHRLIHGARDERCRVTHELSGQSITFTLRLEDADLVSVAIPFTINKNGAWISGKPYGGTRLHKKEGLGLAWGQRRPKKSKELATSVNAWLDLSATGIFD